MNTEYNPFLNSSASSQFIRYLSKQIKGIFPASDRDRRSVPKLVSLIAIVARNSNVPAGTLLSTLIVMRELRERLYTVHCSAVDILVNQEMFMGSLVVTTKYLHDEIPSNKHWAKHSVCYTTEEITVMERRVLTAMGHYISITEEDLDTALYDYHDSMMPRKAPSLIIYDCQDSYERVSMEKHKTRTLTHPPCVLYGNKLAPMEKHERRVFSYPPL